MALKKTRAFQVKDQWPSPWFDYCVGVMMEIYKIVYNKIV